MAPPVHAHHGTFANASNWKPGRDNSHHASSTSVPIENDASAANTAPKVCLPSDALISACNGSNAPVKTARPQLASFMSVPLCEPVRTIPNGSRGRECIRCSLCGARQRGCFRFPSRPRWVW